MKKIRNISNRKYMHALKKTLPSGEIVDDIIEIKAGETKDICDEVANIWLAGGKNPDFEFISDDSKDKEIEELKAQLEEAKAEKEVDEELEALKAEAKALGIKGYGVMKKEALAKKIAEVKASQEENDDVA